MRLLFVHEVDWARKPVFEMHELPELLAARGHEVTYLDYQESERGPLRPRRWRARGRSQPGTTMDLISCRAPVPGIIGRLLVASRSWWIVGRVLRSRAVDVVVLYSVPTNGWAVCWWGRRLGIPVVYRAIDVSHQLRATTYRSLVRRAERYVVSHSAHVSTHNAALGEYLVELAGRPIPFSIDVPGVELGSPPDDAALSSLRRSLGIGTGRKVVLYRGTLYRFAGVPELVALMAPLLRRRPDLLFLIVGEGEARRDVESIVGRFELSESVKVRSFVPRDELHALFRIATVSVNPFQSSMVTDCALPARVLQSLRAGIPCVSTPLRGLVASLPVSLMLRYEEMGPSFVDAAESFVVNPREPSSAHVDALAPLADFTWATAIDRWEAMLSEVTRSARRVAAP